MSETLTRAITGAVYVALTLGAAYAGPATTFLLFLPVCIIASQELHRLTWRESDRAPNVVGYAFRCGLAYLAVGASSFVPVLDTWLVAAILVLLFIIGITGTLVSDRPEPAKEIGSEIAGIGYLALPFGSITHFLGSGPQLFIGFMVMLWTNDTGAYIVGRAIGRTKLMPKVSPKKTVEGLIGGIALTVVSALVLFHFWPVLGMIEWILCAVVVSITSTLGDLLESALKRASGVKDSGRVLPGHGGILDRFDGFLLAAPAMLICVHLCMQHR